MDEPINKQNMSTRKYSQEDSTRKGQCNLLCWYLKFPTAWLWFWFGSWTSQVVQLKRWPQISLVRPKDWSFSGWHFLWHWHGGVSGTRPASEIGLSWMWVAWFQGNMTFVCACNYEGYSSLRSYFPIWLHTLQIIASKITGKRVRTWRPTTGNASWARSNEDIQIPARKR